MDKEIPKKILELAKKHKDYTAQNLSEMTKIKGLSMGEKDICLLVQKQLKEAGADSVEIDKLGNVIAKIGSGKTILAIDGHIDTVDVGNLDDWVEPTKRDPFSGLIKDGYVYGRGTCDQRGGIASFITTVKILKELSFANKDLTILFVASVMEEDCDGLCWKYIIEESKIKPHYVISTESTNGKIYRGHRGRMEIGVEIGGLSCHGSAPHRGINAIYIGAKFAKEIEKLNERIKKDDFLGKGTIAVTDFKSKSPSLCAVSDFVEIHLDRRITWGETKESAIKEVQEIIDKVLKEVKVPKNAKPPTAKVFLKHYNVKSWTGKEYGMEKFYPTWKIEEKHEIVQTGVKAYETLYGKKPGIDKWTFSTNCVMTTGKHKIPAIGFGPGTEDQAHAPNEKIPIVDLERCSAFYAMFIYQLIEGLKKK